MSLFASGSQAVAGSDKVIATIGPLTADGMVSCEVKNTGGAALLTFKVQRQFSVNGGWYDWLSGTDWATPTNRLSPANVSPATLASGASTWFDLVAGPVAGLRFVATAAAGGTTVEVNGGRQ